MRLRNMSKGIVKSIKDGTNKLLMLDEDGEIILTERSLKFLDMKCRGYPYIEIAPELGVSHQRIAELNGQIFWYVRNSLSIYNQVCESEPFSHAPMMVALLRHHAGLSV